MLTWPIDVGEISREREEGESLAHMAYRQLKLLIVSGTTFPGTQLREGDISERLGMSRTPVREALRMLHSEGLVQSTNHRGTQVAHVSRKEVLDAYEAREWLEPVLAARAAERATDDLMVRLQEVIDAAPKHPLTHEESVTAARADFEFHELVLAAAENSVALDLAKRARAITDRAAYYVVPVRYHRSRQEHLQIVAALRRRDPRAAEAAMRNHIAAARQRISGAGREDG